MGGASPVLVGLSTTVAEEMIALVETAGVDGFNFTYTVAPESITGFIDRVVPKLQNRGAYKTSYGLGTLREKLPARGPRPSSPYPAAAYRHPV
ncbi:MAG: hypothetical protein R3E84_15185 [Pseudomonadales bacterium]